MAASEQMQYGGRSLLPTPVDKSEKYEDDLKMFGIRIKQHEENIKFLKAQKNKLDESILDMQVSLGKYHSASEPTDQDGDLSHSRSEKKIVEDILMYPNSAAGIFYQLKTHHESHISNFPWMKNVLGVVATLGRVKDDDVSRLLADYLGTETMLAVVCKTVDCLRALETYDRKGFINKSSGLHGLGATIGRSLDDQFLVICLENIRPYVGDFIANDPQRRLDLLKPKLPNGETPTGFLGFAVNMIEIDPVNLYYATTGGQGLRESLFYHLFSRLQVYRTREDMLQALPLINSGALSLDGGMIRSRAVFSLGNRKDVGLRFPKSSGRSPLPEEYFNTEIAMKEAKWKKERLLEDMRREESLLDGAKFNFEIKRQDFVKFLAGHSPYTLQ